MTLKDTKQTFEKNMTLSHCYEPIHGMYQAGSSSEQARLSLENLSSGFCLRITQTSMHKSLHKIETVY